MCYILRTLLIVISITLIQQECTIDVIDQTTDTRSLTQVSKLVAFYYASRTHNVCQ